MRVLVLDDNPDILALVAVMLQRTVSPCEVVTGRNGVEGLAAMRDPIDKPDAIISNLRMPMMDGFTFVREVRQNPDWADINVATMSALYTPEVLDEAKASGAQVFLRKPFSYDEFKAVLTQLISTHCITS